MAQAELHQLCCWARPREVLAEAYAMLGEIRRDLGDRDGAVSYFSLATETDPEAANPWSALGDLAREDKRWDDALRCYREALREPGSRGRAGAAGLCAAERRQGPPQEANAASSRPWRSDPGEYSAYLGLSECYRHLQRYEDQLRMVKEAMALSPEDPDVWNAQGWLWK